MLAGLVPNPRGRCFSQKSKNTKDEKMQKNGIYRCQQGHGKKTELLYVEAANWSQALNVVNWITGEECPVKIEPADRETLAASGTNWINANAFLSLVGIGSEINEARRTATVDPSQMVLRLPAERCRGQVELPFPTQEPCETVAGAFRKAGWE